MRILKRAIIRTCTTKGLKAKHYVFHLDDKTVRVHRLILMPDKTIDFSVFALRVDTLLSIADFINNVPENTRSKYREVGR